MWIVRSAIVTLLLLLVGACTNNTIYDVGVQQPNNSGRKNELKDDLQFMTIAYRDLFEKEIPVDALETMRKAYVSFGDKELVIDEVVQSFLLSPELSLPNQQDIKNDIHTFISNTYRRFYLRDPSDFELAYWESQLSTNDSLSARDIYYVFMTSQEYKYY